MNIANIPFGTTDWSAVARTEHSALEGKAFWRTQQFGDVRVRMVEYTPGYVSDHWCKKGHILLCLQGQLHTELRPPLHAGARHELPGRRPGRSPPLHRAVGRHPVCGGLSPGRHTRNRHAVARDGACATCCRANTFDVAEFRRISRHWPAVRWPWCATRRCERTARAGARMPSSVFS
jgi:hypothetical protein